PSAARRASRQSACQKTAGLTPGNRLPRCRADGRFTMVVVLGFCSFIEACLFSPEPPALSVSSPRQRTKLKPRGPRGGFVKVHFVISAVLPQFKFPARAFRGLGLRLLRVLIQDKMGIMNPTTQFLKEPSAEGEFERKEDAFPELVTSDG